MVVQPVELEIVPAGAFRRRKLQPWVEQQAVEQPGIDVAQRGPLAVIVIGEFQCLRHQASIRPLPGPVSNPLTDAPGRQQGDIGDTADIDHHAVFAVFAEQGRVKGRNQRRALSAGGDVAAAEIGHRGDAGALGDDAGVAELQGIRDRALRVVADGLAVAADGADVLRADGDPVAECADGPGKCFAEQCFQLSDLLQDTGAFDCDRVSSASVSATGRG